MNAQSTLQRLKGFTSNQRAYFYEKLIELLSAEAEICYPEQARPGKEYDRAMADLALLVRAKGKFHAFYKLNCTNDLIPSRLSGNMVDHDDAEFLKVVLNGLEHNQKVHQQVGDIVKNLVERAGVL